MALAKRTKYTSLTVVVALTATALGAVGPHLINPLAMIRSHSPGVRAAGAITNKKPRVVRRMASIASARPHYVRPAKIAAYRPKRVYAVLPTGVEAPVPTALGTSAMPIATISTPLPAALVPVLGGGSSIGPGALTLLTIPVGIIAGGGGGGGGGVSSGGDFTPAAPEPGTWLMMILGFGFLGTLLRRRRRGLGGNNPGPDAVTMTSALA